MKILNLGCGTKASSSPDVLNIDWSIYLRLRRNRLLRRIAPYLLRGERRSRLQSLPDNVLLHDLRKGLPFKSGSVDVVYHSHFLEHMDRGDVEPFLVEIQRVLRPAGVHRIVVPDFEHACREYLAHVEQCDTSRSNRDVHDSFISRLIEQNVRREGFGTARQSPLQRFIENKLLGDAQKRGEAHRWAYDRHNLYHLLNATGYVDIQVHSFETSAVDGWAGYQLDLSEDGSEYRPGSLYMEARKS